LITSRVSRAEQTKLTKNENMEFPRFHCATGGRPGDSGRQRAHVTVLATRSNLF
jgi:hypothetical protein